MIRVITVCMVWLVSCAGIASAAEGVIRDELTGMQLVWVPKGCFRPDGAAVEQHIQPAPVALIESEYIHENSVLDGPDQPSVAKAAVAEPGQYCVRGFWMGKYEVTQAQYRTIMGKNPSAFQKGDNYPVENVRWLDVRKFIRLLNQQSGKQYRLPSEIEWQYAASSAGLNHAFSGSESAGQVAWYMANSGGSTHPVGTKKATLLGLYDMSGNVWEWTQDCWNASQATAPRDGAANTHGNCAARVLRGGSWYDAEALVGVGARLWNDSDRRDNNSGFRLVLD